MHNVVKRPNIVLKSCGVHIARFLKCVWPFYNIMHEMVTKKLNCEKATGVDTIPSKLIKVAMDF